MREILMRMPINVTLYISLSCKGSMRFGRLGTVTDLLQRGVDGGEGGSKISGRCGFFYSRTVFASLGHLLGQKVKTDQFQDKARHLRLECPSEERRDQDRQCGRNNDAVHAVKGHVLIVQ